jgi:hypothetical protein
VPKEHSHDVDADVESHDGMAVANNRGEILSRATVVMGALYPRRYIEEAKHGSRHSNAGTATLIVLELVLFVDLVVLVATVSAAAE